jgi:hypothetical protein
VKYASNLSNRSDEELVWLDLPKTNGLKLKCIKQGSLNKQVAIIVHGKPGRPNGLVNGETANYFVGRGISCFRLYMYGLDPHTRNLADCSLDTYTQDFKTAVAYIRTYKPQKLFAIGHSYGALAILNSEVPLDAAVLWEPTHGSFWTEYPGIKRDNTKPLNEFEAMGDTTALAANKGYPLKIISAGKGKITEFHERYIAVADEPKAHSVIPKARHNLGDTLEVLDDLRQQTADWLLKSA